MAKIKLRKWDAVEYLKTEEDIVLYLQACMDEAGDDAAFIAATPGDIARVKGMNCLTAIGNARRRTSQLSGAGSAGPV